MSKFSNLYDIDGNIINKAPQHTFTLDEVEKLVDDLTEKVKNNPDNNTYKVYLNNAQKWLFKMYNSMNTDDLMKRINLIQDTVNKGKSDANDIEQKNIEEINKIMDEFKKQYDEEDAEGTAVDTEVEQPVAKPTSQSDMLVERDNVETVMEEVIDEAN